MSIAGIRSRIISQREGSILWLIEGRGADVTVAWDQSEGVSARGLGRYVSLGGQADLEESVLARAVRELEFQWSFSLADRVLGRSITWDRAAVDAHRTVSTARPGEMVARAAFVPAHPPQLPRPIVAVDILPTEPERLADLRALCELALRVPGAVLRLTVELLGFTSLGARSDSAAAIAPTTNEFVAGGRAYGWFRSLAVRGPEAAALTSE